MKKIEKIEAEIQELKDKKHEIFKEKNSEMNEAFKELFYDLPFSHVAGYDQDSIYFEVKDPKSDYNKEIARLSLRKSNWDRKKFDEVHISYYSTSTHSEFELNRLITIGKIAKVVKEFSLLILDTQFKISKKYGKNEVKLNSQIYKKESELNKIHREANEIKKELKRLKAFSKEGISFEKPKHIELKNGRQAWNVENLRILNWVNENKISVNIEVKIKNQEWNEKKQEYVDIDPIVHTFDKIRYSNIRGLVENSNC